MARIDAHHHVWRIDRGDYHWIDPDSVLHRDYTLDDLRPLLTDIVDGTILVQAAPTEAETRFLLDVAEESNGLVRGVVGWVDFDAPDAADRVRALAKHRLIKGLRPMLQDIKDTYWILGDAPRAALRAMIDTGLSLDALIQPRHLAILPVLRVMHPELQVVIDHGAKPPIASKEMDPWDRDLERVANETPYFCKVSGLPAEAGHEWMMNDIRPWFEHIVICFGADRVMWGSDWPVLEQHGAYVRWHTICERFLFMLDPEDRAKVMGGNAERFYRLD